MAAIQLFINSQEDLTRAADAYKNAELGERRHIIINYRDVNGFAYPGTICVHLPLMGDTEAFVSDVADLITR